MEVRSKQDADVEVPADTSDVIVKGSDPVQVHVAVKVVVHVHAPKAKLCFNTKPDDTRESVLRWIRV